MQALETSPHVIVTGPAGCGKTFLAAWWASTQLREGKIDKIVITRPVVSVGKSIGYFPGTMQDKMSIWLAPILTDLKHFLGGGAFEYALKSGQIEMAPFETIRGSSFRNACVIVEECQNATIEECKALVTRIGEGSQLICDGDLEQNDLQGASGLAKLVHLVKSKGLPVPLVEFQISDCVRSGLCAMWLRAFS